MEQNKKVCSNWVLVKLTDEQNSALRYRFYSHLFQGTQDQLDAMCVDSIKSAIKKSGFELIDEDDYFIKNMMFDLYDHALLIPEDFFKSIPVEVMRYRPEPPHIVAEPDPS